MRANSKDRAHGPRARIDPADRAIAGVRHPYRAEPDRKRVRLASDRIGAEHPAQARFYRLDLVFIEQGHPNVSVRFDPHGIRIAPHFDVSGDLGGGWSDPAEPF